MPYYWGPFITNEYGPTGTSTFQKTTNRYRQKAPYLLPLPYYMSIGNSKILPNPWIPTTNETTDSSGINSADPATLDKAYQKFKENAVGISTQIAADYAEREQTMKMLNTRLGDMLRIAFNVARGDFRKAASVLKMDVLDHSVSKKQVRMKIRTPAGSTKELKFKRGLNGFGQNYLEFHFGWEPLIRDIHDAMQILSKTPTNDPMKWKVMGKATYQNTSPPSTPHPNLWSFAETSVIDSMSVRIVGFISVDNPNSLLLNRLGLINPVAVAWEVVPFSFVVDWFANVQNVLNQYTDFVGLDITNAYTSFRNSKWNIKWYNGSPQGTLPVMEKRRVVVSRTLGITMPSVTVRRLKLPSVTRALTASSLLAQFLSTRK